MYKLVVVDDEPLIIEGLKKYLKWEDYGFTIVGEAEDGLKGLKVCKKAKPDFVITDIRMPGADGIELISALKKDLPCTKFVILSGYGEFELAQQAIRAGASDYILKPLQKEQFMQIISKMKNELDQHYKEIENDKQITDVITKNTAVLKNSIIKDILEKGSINIKNNELEFFKLNCEKFRIAVFDNEPYRESIYQEINEFIISSSLDWHLVNFNSYNIILCCTNSNKSNLHVEQLNTLINEIRSKFDIALTIGVGNIVEHLDDLKISYCSAKENLESQFYLDKLQLYENKLNYIDADLVKKHLTSENENLILNALQNGDCLKLESALFAIFEMINLNGYIRPDKVKIFFGEILTRIYLQLKQEDKQIFEIKSTLDEIGRIKSYRNLIEFVRNLLTRQCNSFSANAENDSKKLIKEIKKYIQDNMSQEINLNTIATKFHMNLFYISHLFKKETNMNFLDYLTLLRIDKAKELLTDVNNKVYEVSTRVGYDDQRYFSQVFKKYTGYTPKEFREKRG